jgi:hypothetical protein
VEFLIEVLLTVIDALFRTVWRRVDTERAFRSPTLLFIIDATLGLGSGAWWGQRASHWPGLFWMSVAVALLCVPLAVLAAKRREADHVAPVLSWPWHWPTYRVMGLAVLNLAVAAGIALTFHPAHLR